MLAVPLWGFPVFVAVPGQFRCVSLGDSIKTRVGEAISLVLGAGRGSGRGAMALGGGGATVGGVGGLAATGGCGDGFGFARALGFSTGADPSLYSIISAAMVTVSTQKRPR